MARDPKRACADNGNLRGDEEDHDRLAREERPLSSAVHGAASAPTLDKDLEVLPSPVVNLVSC